MMNAMVVTDEGIDVFARSLAAKTGRHPLWVRRRMKEAWTAYAESGTVPQGYEPLMAPILALLIASEGAIQ